MKYRNVAALLSVMGQLAGLYVWKVRPGMLHWGATAEEQTQPLPGDEVVPGARTQQTRAITINARPEEIWPWLSGVPDVWEIHPEWQHLEVGGLVRTNREVQPGHPLGWEVVMAEPNHTLVLKSKSLPLGTYAFILTPVDGKTRLLVRDRAVWRWWVSPFKLLIFEPLHVYMETGVLQGIKQRAERARKSAPA